MMLTRSNSFTLITKLFLCGSLVLGVGALSLRAHGAVSHTGPQWLQMMAKSGEMLNYAGRFVVSRDGKMNTLKVSHMGSSAGGVQKLSSVDGKIREIVSSDEAVSCLLPDLDMGVKEARQSTLDQYFPMNFKGDMVLLEENYRINIEQMSRVAGRDCQRLAIEPKDQLRYGYLFCIDTENYLLLSSDLINSQGETIEAYRFVDIEFNQVNAQSLEPAVDPASLKWMVDDDQNAVKAPAAWAIKPGEAKFTINHSLTRYSPALQSDIHHIILSDGLANVSAFVVPDSGPIGTQVQQLSMGALNAVTRRLEGYKLTVLGEIPPVTAKLIADSFYMQQ